MPIETAKVVHFNQDRNFGFARLESSEEVFLYGDTGQFIKDGASEPEFTGSSTFVRDGKTQRLRSPRKDDIIVFERQRTTQPGKKDVAKPWGYQSMWQKVSELITKRPVYRAMELYTSLVGGEPRDPKELWRGTDISEALRKFPLPRGNQSPSADPLLPYWADGDGIFEVKRWWEQKAQNEPDEAFQGCIDPRHSFANRT